MKRHLALLVAFSLTGPAVANAGTSWIFAPSRYSHEQATGERVTQHSAPLIAYYRSDPTYLQSGYRHSRTSFQFGDISDNLHVVETWGAGQWIRPYGEWLRPYRAGATPYGPWGSAWGPWTTPYGTIAGPYGLGWGPTSAYRPGYPGPLAAPYAGQQPLMPGQQSPLPTPPQPNPPRSSER